MAIFLLQYHFQLNKSGQI